MHRVVRNSSPSRSARRTTLLGLRVRLPDEPIRDSSTSDFVGQLSLTAWKNWNADFGIQWN